MKNVIKKNKMKLQVICNNFGEISLQHFTWNTQYVFQTVLNSFLNGTKNCTLSTNYTDSLALRKLSQPLERYPLCTQLFVRLRRYAFLSKILDTDSIIMYLVCVLRLKDKSAVPGTKATTYLMYCTFSSLRVRSARTYAVANLKIKYSL